MVAPPLLICFPFFASRPQIGEFLFVSDYCLDQQDMRSHRGMASGTDVVQSSQVTSASATRTSSTAGAVHIVINIGLGAGRRLAL